MEERVRLLVGALQLPVGALEQLLGQPAPVAVLAPARQNLDLLGRLICHIHIRMVEAGRPGRQVCIGPAGADPVLIG